MAHSVLTCSGVQAAVLTVEASKSGDMIFASGVDSKLLCLKRLVAPAPASSAHHYGRAETPGSVEATRWVQAASNRAHSHDVLALAIVEHLSRKGTLHPVLVSGGKDTKICTYSVPDFATTRPRCAVLDMIHHPKRGGLVLVSDSSQRPHRPNVPCGHGMA